jgi:hypothetical protein
LQGKNRAAQRRPGTSGVVLTVVDGSTPPPDPRRNYFSRQMIG